MLNKPPVNTGDFSFTASVKNGLLYVKYMFQPAIVHYDATKDVLSPGGRLSYHELFQSINRNENLPHAGHARQFALADQLSNQAMFA